MTYGEATEFITEFLRGDNSNAVPLPTHFKMALMEISMLCVPSLLKAEYDGTQTDVFRVLHTEEVVVDALTTRNVTYYIKTPIVTTPIVDTDKIVIDQQLAMAVVFFVCSYLSNKYKDRYEAKAEKIISIYVSNEL